MANWGSINVLLKSVIATLCGAVMVMLALSGWDSWSRLCSVRRIAAVVDASSYIFTALYSLRTDRASSYRELMGPNQYATLTEPLREAREADLPALKSAVIALERVDFSERETAVSSLGQFVNKLASLQQETAAALTQPKSARREELARDYLAETNALMEMLDKLSTRLDRLIQLEDAYTDQLMILKHLAWVVRNSGGDSSVIISNTLGGQPLPPDALIKYTADVSKVDTAWAALQEIASGLPLPQRFSEAVERAKREYFDPDYMQLRTKTLKTLIAGNSPGMTAEQWTPMAVKRLGALLGVAQAVLDIARDHSMQQASALTWDLTRKIALLTIAMILTTGMMLVVARRITGPLREIQESMLKLAGGDLLAEVPFTGRKDEIGALGTAMQAFKDGMIDADRLRKDQKEAEARVATQRTTDMQKLADDFQAAIGNIVEAVSSASMGLESAAGTLTKTAEMTQQLSGVVASASEDASANVQSVASAAEEMTGSVNEIARRVHESSKIAGDAVKQAEKTDACITQLSTAASRIGDVVKLITAIAEQTNLLALNATIEAARAGESGKGFAVVAQEVKALAAQTAKATGEIDAQISNMQAATQDSVVAIKEISATIGRIAEIASAIAAAVEQQGAATQEISRNVQHAAQGTAQVATNIADVNRGASETGTASSQVLGSAQSLARESGHLKIEVEKFLRMVRAA